MTIEEKIEVFKSTNLINKQLSESGYVFKEELRKALPSGKEYYWIQFTNQKNRYIKMMLYFFEPDVVSVYIENSVDQDDFILVDWMEKKGIYKTGFFNLDSYSGSFQEKLNSFFGAMKPVFEHPELKPILDGGQWEETPFDWGDMK